MNWEVYPPGIFEMIKQFSAYPEISKIIVTENGAAFSDEITNEGVIDNSRKEFLIKYISEVLRARNSGYPVDGYFVWSFTDNFEWAEGFSPRFGIVHIDFETLKRTVKDSGKWYSNFVKDQISGNEKVLARDTMKINSDNFKN
jgi:beta-glucosidase